MIINKESLKKYTSDEAVLANLEKFTKHGKFQEVDDFIKNHKELPEAHFLNERVGSDATPFLVVRETKTQIKAMRIEAFAISGTAEMDDIKYAYMVDVFIRPAAGFVLVAIPKYQVARLKLVPVYAFALGVHGT